MFRTRAREGRKTNKAADNLLRPIMQRKKVNPAKPRMQREGEIRARCLDRGSFGIARNLETHDDFEELNGEGERERCMWMMVSQNIRNRD